MPDAEQPPPASKPFPRPKHGSPTTYAELEEKLHRLKSVARSDRECPCCGVDPEPVHYAIACLDEAKLEARAVEYVELINGFLECGDISLDHHLFWSPGTCSFRFSFSGKLESWFVPRSDGRGAVRVEPRGDEFYVQELDSGEDVVTNDWEAGVALVSALALPIIEARDARIAREQARREKDGSAAK